MPSVTIRNHAPEVGTHYSTERLVLLYVLLGAALALFILYGIIIYFALDSWDQRNAFGGMFGGVAALFSALAFSGLIYTVHLQRRELALQRQELMHTREEITRQREQLERQSAIFDLQQFEGTFFQLLQLHHARINNSQLEYGQAGHRALTYLKNEVEGLYREENGTRRQRMSNAFAELNKMHEGLLGPYFRSLYYIIRFVDEAQGISAKRYTTFLRAQLSEPEAVLLFFNCAEPQNEKLREFVEKYSLLAHLPVDGRDGADLAAYSPEAFGDNQELVELRQRFVDQHTSIISEDAE